MGVLETVAIVICVIIGGALLLAVVGAIAGIILSALSH